VLGIVGKVCVCNVNGSGFKNIPGFFFSMVEFNLNNQIQFLKQFINALHFINNSGL